MQSVGTVKSVYSTYLRAESALLTATCLPTIATMLCIVGTLDVAQIVQQNAVRVEYCTSILVRM